MAVAATRRLGLEQARLLERLACSAHAEHGQQDEHYGNHQEDEEHERSGACQHLPEGTDLSRYSRELLHAIADEINNRPRNGLGLRSPLVVYRELLINSPPHSTFAHLTPECCTSPLNPPPIINETLDCRQAP